MKTPTIEICNNNEWIENNILDLLTVDDNLIQEACDDWNERVYAAVRDQLGIDAKNPHHQRATYHGWNGTNTWSACGRGWGTFDYIDEKTEQEIDNMIEEITEQINNEYQGGRFAEI